MEAKTKTKAPAREATRHRFKVDAYYRMVQAEILPEGHGVELLDGEVFEMPPIGSVHASIVERLTRLLYRTLPEDVAHIRIQNPIRLDDRSEPEPDIAILLPRNDAYRGAHPAPDDIFLVIEVADSSLAFDRDIKAGIYAKSRIVEYWLIDINSGSIQIWRENKSGVYQDYYLAEAGTVVSPRAVPTLEIAVSWLFE
jgi:Uma2 family endonuclease